MKKRLLALVLGLTLIVMSVAGCGGGSDNGGGSGDSQNVSGGESQAPDTGAANGGDSTVTLDGSWPEETIKIGIEVYDTTELGFVAFQDYLDYLSSLYNLEFMFSESIASAQDELAFVDACAAAGCKGYIGIYNASMNTVVDNVTNYGMYYWGCERGLDEQYKDNEYYLGGFKTLSSDGSESEENGDYLLGYDVAYSLAEAGCKHVAYCNGGAGLGIPMFVDRQTGFFEGIKAAQADGMEIAFDENADIVEGWPGTDDFTAMQSKVLSSDYDGIGVSFTMEVWAQPIYDAGKSDSIKLAGGGSITDSLIDLVDSGEVCAAIYECPEIIFGNAIPMIINAVNGHADLVKGEEGYCDLGVCRWNVKDIDTFTKIYDKHNNGEYFVTAEDMTQFFPEFNENASKESFCEFYRNLTLENAVQ